MTVSVVLIGGALGTAALGAIRKEPWWYAISIAFLCVVLLIDHLPVK